MSSSIESHESESDLTDTSCSEESVQPSISFSSNEVTLNQTQEPSQISNLSDESLIENNTSISVVMNIDFRYQFAHVPYPAWYEPYIYDNENRIPVRRRIHRDNKISEGNNLPVISVSNLRSIMPKINHFKEDMLERDITLSLLSEVWEQSQNKKHKFEIEKLCQMDGLKYISTPRVSTKRGGGAAIVVNLKKYSLDRIQVNIPHNLEVVWGLVKPKSQNWTQIKQIIVCAFYSPPNSKKNTKLLDHMISTTHNLLTKYPQAGIVMGGDKNKLNIGPLINAIPRLRQIVTKFTYQHKILDVILTNLHQFYCVTVVVPPVLPDQPGHGVPSDHSVPVAYPQTDKSTKLNEYKTVKARPLPDSGIRKFGQWICSEQWDGIENKSPNDQAKYLQEILTEKVEKIFPQKTFKISMKDKPFMTKELKQLDRTKKRVYRKQGKSIKYMELKSKFDHKYKKAASEHLENTQKN